MKTFVQCLSIVVLMIPSIAKTDMKYPYIASEERANHIMTQFTKIKVGDSEKRVIDIMTEPDLITDLFSAQKHQPDLIGKAYWYIIQRLAEDGSVEQKQEKLVRFLFDLQGNVTRVDHWGF